MIFLKKVFINGFKSFANKINLNFNHQLTAIIGPNGAGKSNFIDSIRWILGDKITKQMRIQNYNDLIFSGTKKYPPADFANVKLYFDNSKKIFDYDLNEVILEKIVYRDDFNAETFINRHPIAQKEVVEMMAGLGIVNFGLSFISQSIINQMINYKPEEIKQSLLAVSGLLQYRKNKTRIFKNLIQSKEKLNELSIIFAQEETKFNKLLKEVEKAEIYRLLKTELSQKEIWFLVKEINLEYNRFSQNEKKSKSITSRLDLLNKKKVTIKQQLDNYQINVESLEKDLIQISNDIENINILLFNLDQDLNLKTSLDHKSLKKFLINLKEENTKLEKDLNSLSEEESFIKLEVNKIELKIKENEYQISFLKKQLKDLDFKFKENFSFCYGYIKDLFSVQGKYQKAVAAALGHKLKNILVHDNDTAKQIIDYLTTNKLFKATFLIYDQIKEIDDNREAINHILKSLKIKHLILDPFIDLISFEKRYFKVFNYLFKNILLTSDFQTAKYLKPLLSDFIIVTLDGEVFWKKEVITGGHIRLDQNQTINSNIKDLEDKNINLTNKYDKLVNNLNRIRFQINHLKTEQAEVYKELIKYEYQNSLFAKNASQILDKTQSDLKIDDYKDKLRKLNLQFKVKQNQKNQLFKEQKINFEDLGIIENEIDILTKELETLNFNLHEEKINIKNFSIQLVQNYQLTIEQAQEISNNLSFSDVSLLEINTLKDKLSRLGEVNLDSLKIYETEKERHQKLKTEYTNISKSIYHIETTISFLDDILNHLFTDFINQINHTLPSIFHNFYNHGRIFLKQITNSDDSELSGIEISAIFPAKKESFFLANLSGGEKTLVIVCILLAVLKIKKLPLVIFDEVDANLDPVNASKLGILLNQFSNDIQFILVTHRNQLMVHCPVLYGATTHGKGITSIVGINIKNSPINLVDNIDKKSTEKWN